MSKNPTVWPTHRLKSRRARALAHWRRRQQRLGKRDPQGQARLVDDRGPNRLPRRTWEGAA